MRAMNSSASLPPAEVTLSLEGGMPSNWVPASRAGPLSRVAASSFIARQTIGVCLIVDNKIGLKGTTTRIFGRFGGSEDGNDLY